MAHWKDLQRGPGVLRVLHALYLHGARYFPTFESEHPCQYHYTRIAMQEALQLLVESDEVHSASSLAVLSRAARLAWSLLELLLRTGLPYHCFLIIVFFFFVIVVVFVFSHILIHLYNWKCSY